MKLGIQFLLFAVVGAAGTGGHYFVLILLVQLFHVTPVVASSIGFMVGAVINYALNYKITFRSNARHLVAVRRFFTVALVGAVINSAIVWGGIHFAMMPYLIAQVIATAVVLIINFALNKIWTFNNACDRQFLNAATAPPQRP